MFIGAIFSLLGQKANKGNAHIVSPKPFSLQPIARGNKCPKLGEIGLIKLAPKAKIFIIKRTKFPIKAHAN